MNFTSKLPVQTKLLDGLKISQMVYSHCAETGPGTGQGKGMGSMGSIILHRNVHTGPR